MPFTDILDHVTTSAESGRNIITDGRSTCTYADLPALLEPIERSLSEQRIHPGTTLAVECTNSLAGGLLLLTLLKRGNSFLLAPQTASLELKPTPNFCQYRLAGLRAEVNPDYNGKPPDSQAKLYLRTSGSMGPSKIVVHTQEKLLGNARNCANKYGFASEDRCVIPVPIAHMYGFGAEFLPAIITGASIDLQEKTNLLKYLDREKRFQPTIAFTTPAICDMLLKGFKTPRTGYKVFVTSGQRISEELFCAFDPCVGGRLVNQYGSSEMGATAACDPGDSLDSRAQTIGRPMPGVQLRVDAGLKASELYAKHPYGFEGYVDEDGNWLEQARADGWYRTGDVAEVRPDGGIAVLGRADASVNRSGYLVLLSDIERIMEKLEAIGEVAVVAGHGESKQGQRIAAFCVPRPGISLTGLELRQRCFEVLPHHAIPDEVRVIEMLPLLPSGKVDRKTLERMVY